MRAITRCPACQTQFFVSDAQLDKHDGKVRCGQCLHVFNAKSQFITPSTLEDPALIQTAPTDQLAEITPSPAVLVTDSTTHNANLTPDVETNVADASPTPGQTSNQNTPEWPLIDDILDDDDRLNLASFNHNLPDPAPSTDELEQSASHEDVLASFAEPSNDNIAHDSNDTDVSEDDYIVDDDDFIKEFNQLDSQKPNSLNDITKLTVIADDQANYFDDLAKGNKTAYKHTRKKLRRWPWLLASFILLLIAAAQTIYYLRNDIAMYYPNVKPYLLKACQPLNCSISLPKQINLIVIDDSDMQEDTNLTALMHFSSSLINQAAFAQAYPNLELTLTDVEDKPILRRIFKPNEYLPSNTDVALGFKAGEEIKIKLGITTQGVAVAGYRIFVTY